MVVVEVRQGTLSMDGRGWGPTENTVDRGSQLDEEDEEDDEEDDDEEEEEEERRRRGGEEEQATDIKSNNPHLAGGEKTETPPNRNTHIHFDSVWKRLLLMLNTTYNRKVY